jgi:hypothetical protein
MNINDDMHGNPSGTQPGGQAHGRHGWMMIACCIPMLVIALVLVTAGVVSVGFLFAAIICTAMMAMMMRGMNHGSADK